MTTMTNPAFFNASPAECSGGWTAQKSAKGQKATCRDRRQMSALPPGLDIGARRRGSAGYSTACRKLMAVRVKSPGLNLNVTDDRFARGAPCPLRHDLALVHHQPAIGEAFGHAEVLLDDDKGGARRTLLADH